jgi:hypothetical protein
MFDDCNAREGLSSIRPSGRDNRRPRRNAKFSSREPRPVVVLFRPSRRALQTAFPFDAPARANVAPGGSFDAPVRASVA